MIPELYQLLLEPEHAYRYTDEDGAHDYYVHADGWLSYLDDMACRAPIDHQDLVDLVMAGDGTLVQLDDAGHPAYSVTAATTGRLSYRRIS